jgi:hypothetical protein
LVPLRNERDFTLSVAILSTGINLLFVVLFKQPNSD